MSAAVRSRRRQPPLLQAAKTNTTSGKRRGTAEQQPWHSDAGSVQGSLNSEECTPILVLPITTGPRILPKIRQLCRLSSHTAGPLTLTQSLPSGCSGKAGASKCRTLTSVADRLRLSLINGPSTLTPEHSSSKTCRKILFFADFGLAIPETW